VSSSACSRDRSNGSSGGACTCITCNAHPVIGEFLVAPRRPLRAASTGRSLESSSA
jgi:hypothetical protein